MAEESKLSGIDAFLAGVPEEAVQAESTNEVVSEAPPEVAPEAQPEAEKPVAEQTKFFEQFNKLYKTGYKSDEEISALLASSAKVSEYEAKVKEMETYKAKHDELTAAQKAWLEEKAALEAQVNPLSFFRDEKAFVAEQLRRKFPDKDPIAMERLMTSDLSRMDKVELLAQRLLLDTPELEGGLEGAREIVLSELGVDMDSKPEEWDRITKNKLSARATQARRDLEELKARAEVEIPKVKTQEDINRVMAERQEGLKRNWTPFLDKMEAIDKLQIPAEDGTVLATIDIPAEWRKEMRQELMDAIVAGGVEPNEENIVQLNAMREQRFIHRNLPKLYTILENQWKSKAIEERDKLLNNTEPPNTSIKPDEKPDDTGTGMRAFLERY